MRGQGNGGIGAPHDERNEGAFYEVHRELDVCSMPFEVRDGLRVPLVRGEERSGEDGLESDHQDLYVVI